MPVLMSKMFSSAEAEADVPEASKFGSGNNFLISILSNGKIKENSDECGFWCELDIWLNAFFQRWPLADQQVLKQLGLKSKPKVFCRECPKVIFPWTGYFLYDNPPASVTYTLKMP